MLITRTLLSVFALAFFWTMVCMGQTAEDLYKAGIIEFQKNNLEKSRDEFQKALDLQPENPLILFNLGMTEYKAGKAGLAIALWRKALEIKPQFAPAVNALSWATKRLENPELPRELTTWDTFRAYILAPVTMGQFLIMTALLLLLSGWLLLRYLGAWKENRQQDLPAPPIPIPALALAVLFTVMAVFSGAKAYDMSFPRATVTQKKVEVRTVPTNESAVLFELFEGLAVIVRQFDGAWVQVTYPGGLTGWIPKEAIFVHHSRPL